MANSGGNSPPKKDTLPCTLPANYVFLDVMGKGGFGVVAKCFKQDSKETVAVKVLRNTRAAKREVWMLKNLMNHKLDKYNIVRFHESFEMTDGSALVFERLDISLHTYMMKSHMAPLQLEVIRTVIQQLATALNALKNIGVVHTDIKLDNIMLVDHHRQPLRVKLIDFGLAILRSEARQGYSYQARPFRSPEIILGAPFTEAIDMWSLGCVMAAMLGVYLFPGFSAFEVIHYQIDLLGQPADDFVDTGEKSLQYFEKMHGSQWRLVKCKKTHQKDRRRYTFRSLDALKRIDLDEKDPKEVVDRWECIELLKAMLRMDPRERITPSKVLTHPFVTKSHLIGAPHLYENLKSVVEPEDFKELTLDQNSSQKLGKTAREDISETSDSSSGEIFWSTLPQEDVLDQPSNSDSSQENWMMAEEVFISIQTDSDAEIFWPTTTTLPPEDVLDQSLNTRILKKCE